MSKILKSRILALLIAGALTMPAWLQVKGEDYRLLYINQGNIQVDGRILDVGDTIKGGSPIKWETPNQAIKVLDLGSHQHLALSAKQLEKSHQSSILSYFKSVNHLSSRDSDSPLTNTSVCLIDSIMLDPGVEVDFVERFTARFKLLGTEKEIDLPIRGDSLVLRRDLLPAHLSDETLVNIYGNYPDSEEAELLIENLTLYLPDEYVSDNQSDSESD